MILTLLFAAATAAAPAPKRCLMPSEAARGEFRWVETRHPNGQPLRYPFIVLPTAACVQDGLGESEGRWVQLNFKDQTLAKKLKSGDTVTVAADYIAPQTAWHIGDIIADQAELSNEDPL